MSFMQMSAAERQLVIDGNVDSEVWRMFPFYPLTSPGIPPAGDNFSRHAESTGEGISRLYFEALYSSFCMPVTFKNNVEPARIIPGHFWGRPDYGPALHDTIPSPRVLVLGKMPGYEELEHMRNFFGTAGQQLMSTLVSVVRDEWRW